MRRNTLIALLGVVAVLTGACGGDSTSSAPPKSSSPTPSPTPDPLKGTRGFSIVFSGSNLCPSNKCTPSPIKNDLFVYVVESDSVRRLTTDGTKTAEVMPSFLTGSRISFVKRGESASSMWTRNLDGSGSEEKLFDLPANSGFYAYSWNAAKDAVAMLIGSGETGNSIAVWKKGDDKPKTIRLLGEVQGRGVGDFDDLHVSWSRDDASLLVVDTFVSKGNIYLVRPDGSDVLPPREGTFARFSSDSKTIYFRGISPDPTWRALAIEGDTETKVMMNPDGLDPVLSPDGKAFAYHDGKDTPSAYIYDIATDSERRVGTGAVPLWLDTTSLVVTNTRPCSDDECGEAPRWVPTGSTSMITVAGGASRALALPWSVHTDVLYR